MYHTMYSRVMQDHSRILDFASKGSRRAAAKAKRALVRAVREDFASLAVGAAENNNLAVAVANVKAGLDQNGQQDGVPAAGAGGNVNADAHQGELGPQGGA